MDSSRSVKDGAEDSKERVMTSHTEMCEQSGECCKVTSVEEGHDVEFENYAKESQEAKINGLTKLLLSLLVKGLMTVVTLKQLKDEMSADLTAFKKKGLDRKTYHQDLTKAETEIFVLIKATVGALKLEQSLKEVAQPRPTRPPPWRDKCNRGREFGVACTLVLGARGYKPRRGDEIHPLYAYCTQHRIRK